MLSKCHILNVNIKECIPIFLNESQVNWTAENNRAGGVSSNWSHFEGDIGELETLKSIWFSAIDFDFAIVWVLNCVRMLFLDNNFKVVGETGIPNTVWSECNLS